MKVFKSFRFKLCPTTSEQALLAQHGGLIRTAWNKLNDYSYKFNEDNQRFPNKKEMITKLNSLKVEFPFLKVAHSQPLQNASYTLSDTIVKSFRKDNIGKRKQKLAKAYQEIDTEKQAKAVRKALNFAMPKFKRKADYSDSIFYPQAFKIKKSRVYFPKLGWISYVKHRPIEGTPKFLTIVQEGSEWYVSITCEVKIQEMVKPDLEFANVVGIDVGLTTFATLSDGTEIKNPRTLKKHLAKLRRAQRTLSRRQIIDTGEKTLDGKAVKKSSSNRNKQIHRVQTLHKRVKNIRNDFLHKTTHHIITKYDGIALETLDIHNMLRVNGKAMNRSIQDVSWFKFGQLLKYKSLWNSKYFVQIDQYEPSTQECNVCHERQTLSLKHRIYSCPHCGYTCGRDLNASKNILEAGLKILQNTVASTEIYACGEKPSFSMKQEKLRYTLRKARVSESQALSFRGG